MIATARPDFSSPRQVLSGEFHDGYRSDRGAFEEAGQVFLGPCELATRWQGRRHFVVLELGLGCAINFLATLRLWRETRPPGGSLQYIALERHPLSRADLGRALEVYRAADHVLSRDLEHLRRRWPLPLAGLHRIRFDEIDIDLTIALGDARSLLPRLELAADAVFLDGFAPSRNPEMWEPRLMQAVARRTRADAILATYSSAPEVRSALETAGFEVRRLRGFGGKKRRVVATPCSAMGGARFATPPADVHSARYATIVGGGLAGFASAHALCRRGWSVRLLESSPSTLTGASGQPALAQHPHLSPDDNLLARLSRAAWQIADLPVPALSVGRLNIPADDQEASNWQRTLARNGFPDAYAHWVDAEEARRRSGWPVGRDGLWLETMGAWDPCAIVEYWRRACGARLRVETGRYVDHMVRTPDGWRMLAISGETLAESPVVVLANAGDAARLAQQTRIPIQARIGQTTRLGPLPTAPRAILGGSAYACPLGDGTILTGAWSEDPEEAVPPRHADAHNLERLAALLKEPARDWHDAPITSGARGTRYSTPDRLPLIGAAPDEAAIGRDQQGLERNDRLPLPRLPGLHLAACFGGRGLLWAPLAAEILAAALEGEPPPIERDLLDAVDPARFARRLLRHQRWGASG